MTHRLLLSALSLCLVACASVAPAPQPAARGHLILIGGGDKPLAAMQKFVELAGGKDAPIVVIPTASGEADTPAYYLDLFRKDHGATDVVVLEIRTREDAARPDFVAAMARARGVFFAGGDQSRVTKAMLDTPVLEAMRAAHRQGAVIGGTSAGTACQSRHMITGEGDFKVIREGAVELVEGLGFLEGIIVDQHFIARQRENRLFTVILEHPDHLGVGVDEDTAAWFRPDGTFEVIGARSVMVVDAAEAEVRRGPAAAAGGSLLGAGDLRLHIVLPGEVFDIGRRAMVHALPTEPVARRN